MKDIKWAVLGTGVIANEMAVALQKNGKNIYAVGNRTYDKAVTFAEKYGIGKVYSNYNEMFTDPDVDVIYITTPHNTHIQFMRKAIENGKHILVEKSITLNSSELGEMLELAKQLDCEKSIVLGYRDELFLNDEFEAYGKVYLATEDGSAGTKGNVLDAVKACGIEGDILFACGPTPMLRAIKQYAKENGLECYLSLEEKMACGIGACLACVCKSTQVDDHSKVHNKRVCKEGPVFNAEEVEL